MGGPGSGRKRSAPRAAPRGARWLEARQQMFARYGDVCWLCGHPGATEADHMIPGALLDAASYHDVGNLRPAHGHRAPCAVCGKACNQVRGGPQRILRNGNGNGVTKRDSAKNPGGRAQKKRSEAKIRAAFAAIEHRPGCECLERALAQGWLTSRCW